MHSVGDVSLSMLKTLLITAKNIPADKTAGAHQRS